MSDAQDLVPDPDESELLLSDENRDCGTLSDGEKASGPSKFSQADPNDATCEKLPAVGAASVDAEAGSEDRTCTIANSNERQPLLTNPDANKRAPLIDRSPDTPVGKTVTRYHSLSVHLHVPSAPKARPGSLSIVESDKGDEHDLFSIDVSLLWKPHARDIPSTPRTVSPICLSIDDMMALRIVLNAHPHPRVTLHAFGGVRVATFAFPNGRDAAMAFVSALRGVSDTSVVIDRVAPGELYMLEGKPRMRRVAPSIEDGPDVLSGESSNADAVGRVDHSQSLTDRIDPSGSPDLAEDVGGPRGASGRRLRARANVRDPDSALRADPGMVVLESFARVTQLVRDVGDDLQWVFSEKRRQEDAAREERERLARERALDIYADLAWPGSESDSDNRQLPPRLVLEARRGVPLSSKGWRASLGESGVIMDSAIVRLAVFSGGVSGDLRAEVWPFLLNVFPWDSSAEDRDRILQRKIDQYAELKARWLDLKSEANDADSISIAKAMEAASAAAAAAAEKEGTPMPDEGDLRIPDRASRVSKRYASYLATDEQIMKDIVRTDRKVDVYVQNDSRMLSMMGDILNVYAVYNTAIGYCQGMSDYLSPLLHVFGEHQEALAFWCFEGLMQMYQANFRVDQSGMTELLTYAKNLLKSCDAELFAYFQDTDPDMYCIFRWMLVCFKRELPFEETPRLWEILWTHQMGQDKFHVYVAIALLRAHRRNLLKLERGGFDVLLRYVNDMSQRIDVDFAVRQAEILCKMSY